MTCTKILLKKELGCTDDVIEDVADELYCARYNYRFDDEMQEFFKTLTHVKYDLTGDGPLQIGDEISNAKDIILHHLDSASTVTLEEMILSSKSKGVPLVILAGSWT